MPFSGCLSSSLLTILGETLTVFGQIDGVGIAVPSIGMPASSSACANPSGVWPPNCTSHAF